MSLLLEELKDRLGRGMGIVLLHEKIWRRREVP